MSERSHYWLPIVLVVAFAITRWPELMPPNFSAAYALAFCAGVYFGKWSAWVLPLGVLLLTDLALNLYYGQPLIYVSQLFNYVSYALLIGIGRMLGSRASVLTLLSGSLFGAVLFYLITNTAAWFFNHFQSEEYTRDWAGWTLAMTYGTASWPETWVFFRNTLASTLIFTAIPVIASKLAERHRQLAADPATSGKLG